MKALTTLLVALLNGALCMAQNAPLVTETNHEAKGTSEQASIMRTHRNSTKVEAGEYIYTPCEKYKAMKTTGIVLTSVGGGLFVAGVAILSASNSGLVNNGNDNGYYRGTTPLRAGGAAAVTMGSISLAVGIPLTVVGSIKSKRTCGTMDMGRGRSYLELNRSGLALKF